MRFRLKKGKGSVSGFTDSEGVTHLPGDVVELPDSSKGEVWLEPVEVEPKVKAPAAKLDKVEASESKAVEVPFELEKGRKSKKTKSESS